MKEKSVPELQEPLQLPEDGRLQVPLAVGVCEPQEVQEVGVPEDQIGCHAVLLLQGLQLLPSQLHLAPHILAYNGS